MAKIDVSEVRDEDERSCSGLDVDQKIMPALSACCSLASCIKARLIVDNQWKFYSVKMSNPFSPQGTAPNLDGYKMGCTGVRTNRKGEVGQNHIITKPY